MPAPMCSAAAPPLPPPAPPPPSCPPPIVTFIGILPDFTASDFNLAAQNAYTTLVYQQAVGSGGVDPEPRITMFEDRPVGSDISGINVHTEVIFPGPLCQEAAAAAFAVYLNTNQTWIKTAYGTNASVVFVNLG